MSRSYLIILQAEIYQGLSLNWPLIKIPVSTLGRVNRIWARLKLLCGQVHLGDCLITSSLN